MDETDPRQHMTNIGRQVVEYTSSTEVVASPPDALILELGERILAELGADRTNDTLTRWLAHHVARLIAAADDALARDDLDADKHAAEARDAILQLWEHRTDWPDGWPPSRAAGIVRLLETLPDSDTPQYWRKETTFSYLQTLHYQVLAAICDLATADGDNIEQGWLNKFGELLTSDEITLLTRAATVRTRLEHLLLRRKSKVTESTTEQPGIPNCDDKRETANHPLVLLANTYRNTVLDILGDATSDPRTGDECGPSDVG